MRERRNFDALLDNATSPEGSKHMLEVRKHRVSVDGYKEVTHTVAKYVEAIRIGSVDLLASTCWT
jgi:hypothetical protein